MNIARFTLSIVLLTSVASMSAHEEVTTTTCEHGCDHSSTPVDASKTVSIDTTIEQAVKDFELTDAEATELRTRLEAAGEDADVAVIVAEIRTENSAAEVKQEEVAATELI